MDVMFYNYLGLGDHFIHHGSIREIVENGNYINKYVLTKPRDLNNLKILFKDTDVEMVTVDGHNQALQKIQNFKGKTYSQWWLNHTQDEITKNVLEDIAYLKLGIDPKLRYDNFRKAVDTNRDHDKENTVFNDMVGDLSEYILVSDDASRGYKFNDDLILNGRDIKIIRTSDYPNYNLFDMLTVMEKSLEIHVMYSSFLFFCDQYSGSNIELPKIVLHESYLNKIGLKDLNNPKLEYSCIPNKLRERNIRFI